MPTDDREEEDDYEDDFEGGDEGMECKRQSGEEKGERTRVEQTGGHEERPTEQQLWKTIDFKDIEMGKRIGGGGVGVIYSGYYQDEEVALKTLFDPRVSEPLKREYLDELLIMASLDHPNIVRFVGASMEPPNLFFVMERCDASLFEVLHKERRDVGARELVGIALDVGRAMDYLHHRTPPIIHRDLKSQNLLMDRDGVIKLCDFGLVRTKATMAGTPAYMAPELLQNKPFNKAVDVYAFGMLLWEMFSGEIPFYDYEVTDIRDVIVGGDRPSVPRGDTPRAVRDLIQDCWAQAPNDRPDFGACVRVLEEALADMPEKSNLDLLHAESDFGGDALDSLLK